jgi:ribosome-binding protein aMBF1 (putative translation factor)
MALSNQRKIDNASPIGGKIIGISPLTERLHSPARKRRMGPRVSDSDLHQKFGRRLAETRAKRGYEVAADFAREIGVSGARLSAWENGIAFPNNLLPLKRMVDLLGVTSDYLLFGDTRGLSPEAHRAVGAAPKARRSTGKQPPD